MAAGEVLTLCAFRTPSPPERLSLGLVGLSISLVQPVEPVGASCDFRRSSNSISAASAADVYPRTTFVSSGGRPLCTAQLSNRRRGWSI